MRSDAVLTGQAPERIGQFKIADSSRSSVKPKNFLRVTSTRLQRLCFGVFVLREKASFLLKLHPQTAMSVFKGLLLSVFGKPNKLDIVTQKTAGRLLGAKKLYVAGSPIESY